MQREYMNYVNVACKEGMTPEEVQSLFNEIYSKSDTKKGKRVLRLFSKGIGKAKKNTLKKQYKSEQMQNQPQNIQQKSHQYVYKQY